MKKSIDKQRRNAFIDLILLICIITVGFFLFVYFDDTSEPGHGTVCAIFAVAIMVGLMIYKATSIIYDLVEREKNFITLFLLQEIRNKKVYTAEELTELINGTVEDLCAFSSAFYKLFNDDY